jgi:diguanylate cyclase (GGDEF)-like protein
MIRLEVFLYFINSRPMSDLPIFCTDGKQCQLEPKLDALAAEVEQLTDLVTKDTLTGLSNYRHFTNVVSQEMERSRRTGQPMTLIIIDADHFKKVNDNWGHEVGNHALKLISSCIVQSIRQLDIACRYGGEEFVVIFPSTDITTSIRVAERIRAAIESTPLIIQLDDSDEPIKHPLTVSIGVSSFPAKIENDDWHKLVERADNKLYEAKLNGRNQVCYGKIATESQQVSEDEKSALFDIFNSE